MGGEEWNRGEGGDYFGGPYYLLKLHLHISAAVMQNIKVSTIEYEIHSHSQNIEVLVSKNLGMWCVGECLGRITFSEHVRGIK